MSVLSVNGDTCMQIISYEEYQVVLAADMVCVLKEYDDMVWSSKFYKFKATAWQGTHELIQYISVARKVHSTSESIFTFYPTIVILSE